jgi:hypothetical protein
MPVERFFNLAPDGEVTGYTASLSEQKNLEAVECYRQAQDFKRRVG